MDHLHVPGRAGAGAELQVEEHSAGLGDGDVDWNGDTLINMRIEIVPLLPCIFIRPDGVCCAVESQRLDLSTGILICSYFCHDKRLMECGFMVTHMMASWLSKPISVVSKSKEIQNAYIGWTLLDWW